MAGAASAEDWSQWRGHARTGHDTTFEPPTNWPETLEPRWTVEIGDGDASPLVVDGTIYSWTRSGDDEMLSALDLASGDLVWQQKVGRPFKPLTITEEHAAGPFSTPAYANSRLFTFGILGQVDGWSATDGSHLWTRTFDDEFRFPRPFYGTAQSPLVYDDVVILSVGGAQGGALIAFDQATGEDIWRLDLEGPSYGSGILAELGGQEILVTPTRKRLIGVDLETGTQLFETPFEVRSDDWSQTPLVVGDLVIVSTGMGPSKAYRIQQENGAWSIEDAWTSTEFWLRFSSPVLVGNRAFGFAEQKKGQLVAFDPQTGEVLWQGEGRQGEVAWLVAAADLLFAFFVDARLEVYSTGETIERIAIYDDIAPSSLWPHPALVGQELVIKDAHTVRAFSLLESP